MNAAGIRRTMCRGDPAFQILQLNLAEMKDFADHPFTVKMDEDMVELVESIRKNGVLHPDPVVRPDAERRSDGGDLTGMRSYSKAYIQAFQSYIGMTI